MISRCPYPACETEMYAQPKHRIHFYQKKNNSVHWGEEVSSLKQSEMLTYLEQIQRNKERAS